MIRAIILLKNSIIILITQKKYINFYLCKVIFTAVLHFRALIFCPCFLQLHGFCWQGWRKHTKPVLSGGLPWLTDPTTCSAGNNFLALQCGLKTMEKNPARSYTDESFHLNSQSSYSKIHLLDGDVQQRHTSNHLERCYTLEEQQTFPLEMQACSMS